MAQQLCPAPVFTKSVYLLKPENITRRYNDVYLPHLTTAMDSLKRSEQRQKLQFHESMSEGAVQSRLEETFTALQNRRYSCAARESQNSTRLEFHGERRVWDGMTIKRKIKGGSALYIVVEDEDEILSKMSGPCLTGLAVSGNNNQSTPVENATFTDASLDLKDVKPGPYVIDLKDVMDVLEEDIKNSDQMGNSRSGTTEQITSFAIIQEQNKTLEASGSVTTTPSRITDVNWTTSLNVPSQSTPSNTGATLPDFHLVTEDLTPTGPFNFDWKPLLDENLKSTEQTGSPISSNILNGAENGAFQTYTANIENQEQTKVLTSSANTSGISEGSGNSSDENSSKPDEVIDQESTPHETAMTINPSSGPLEGGGSFHFTFNKKLPESLTEGSAEFGNKKVQVWKSYQGFILHGLNIPRGDTHGTVIVTVIDDKLVKLGETYFTYVDERKEMMKYIVSSKRRLAELFYGTAKWLKTDDDEGAETQDSQQLGLSDQLQPEDILQPLIYAAAEIGATEFIEIIYSLSAGKIVFQAYKNDDILPEDIAEENGHEQIAAYLRRITKRFSEEEGAGQMPTGEIDWLELAKAFEENKERSGYFLEKDDSETEYFGDAETPSNGSNSKSSDCNDELERMCPKGNLVSVGNEDENCDDENDLKLIDEAEKLSNQLLGVISSFTDAGKDVDEQSRNDSEDKLLGVISSFTDAGKDVDEQSRNDSEDKLPDYILPTLIGTLVDVSYTMKSSVGDDEVQEEDKNWARSIFKAVDQLIKHDVSSSNQIFVLTSGSPSDPRVFDLLSTVGKAAEDQSAIEDLRSSTSKEAMIEEALSILERNGAKRVRYWGKMDVLLKVVGDTTAATILHYLRRSSDFTERFIHECLPRECREVVLDARSELALELGAVSGLALGESFGPIGLAVGLAVGAAPLLLSTCSAVQTWASEDLVRKAMEKGKRLVDVQVKVDVSKAAIKSVHNAFKILHTIVGDQEVTDERVDKLMKAVEPYVCGSTSLMQAMHHSVKLFSYPEFKNHRKLLFIVSDGKPTDGNNPPLQRLSDLGVTIVSCFITDQKLSDPCRLYSIPDESWEGPAKFMFGLSSTIKTQAIPRTLFVKRGWQIDIDNNETRLFFQVNHPHVIKDACHMIKNVVLSHDALADALASVDLDIYINKLNEGFGPKEQHGNTSYAHASAAVLCLSMKRIIGRDGGYPDFFELRHELIAKYGVHGASTKKVLNEICPKYRLRCQVVDANGAMQAVSAKRPVVALFRLTGAQWDRFIEFYGQNPNGILTRSYLDSQPKSTSHPGGHAVVLTSYDAKSLRLMNSWGDKWADKGFFRVQNSDVLDLEFVDVFWTLDDLSPNEKSAYDRHGAEVATKLMRSLKGLQVAKYTCSLCLVESKVVDFSGNLQKVKCPKCFGTFNANSAGGDLVLNLYLMASMHQAPKCIEVQTCSQ